MPMQKIQVIGNIGKAPDLKQLANGELCLNFSLAVNVKDKQKGQEVETSTWYRVSIFGKRAQALHSMLHSGKQVFVGGDLRASIFNGQNGPMLSMDIKNADVVLIGKKEDNQDGHGQQAAPRQQQQRAPQNAPTQEEAAGDGGYEDDEIPF